jgi:small multidrug resistance pump
MTMGAERTTPRWMSTVLLMAGIYNMAWGTWTILCPTMSFSYSGIEVSEKPLHYPQLWQGIGMIVGVYGIGYALAARDPVRLWPLVLVGLLGKVFGPVGLVYGVITNQMSIAALITMIPNDLIWWVPFGLILRRAYWESKAIPR